MNTNETLQRNVVEQLEWDPAVDSSNIGVTVAQGVVTLSGSVRSFAEKFRAVKLTKAIRGVKGIADELEVAPTSTLLRSDSDLAAMAIKALEWDSSVPHEHLQVTVRDGHIKLEGELEWQFQRQAAERAVQGLSGVKSIQNLTTIKRRASPKDVKRSIVEALHRSAQEDAYKIAVEVVGEKTILSGTTHTWAAREEAEEAAWSAPGITHVDNRIVVNPKLMVH